MNSFFLEFDNYINSNLTPSINNTHSKPSINNTNNGPDYWKASFLISQPTCAILHQEQPFSMNVSSPFRTINLNCRC